MRTIADHLFDILENSVKAEATKVIITLSFLQKMFFCRIIDNGKKKLLKKATDPFVTSRKTRRVGLGLPLLKETAESTGGYLRIEHSGNENGTVLEFTVNMAHIDARPFGNLPNVFTDMIFSWPTIEFDLFTVNGSQEQKVIDTVNIKNTLGMDSLQDQEIVNYLRKQIQDSLNKMGINQMFGKV